MIYRYHQFDQYDGRETAEAVFESIVAAFPQARKRFVKQNERYWREFVERIQTYLPPLAIKYFEIYHDCTISLPLYFSQISSISLFLLFSEITAFSPQHHPEIPATSGYSSFPTIRRLPHRCPPERPRLIPVLRFP